MDRTRTSRIGRGESRLLIRREALLHNAELIRSRLAPGTQIYAVVKANGYGHGASIVADTLCHYAIADDTEPPVHRVVVATIDEASSLPELSRPITILQPIESAFVGTNQEKLSHAIRNGWTLTLTSPAAADDLERIAQRLGSIAIVQIMVDTGLNRCGVAPSALPRLLDHLRRCDSIRVESLASHFANGEQLDDDFTRQQLGAFRRATDHLAIASEFRLTRHVAASGAIFTQPDSHLDAIRPGLALYGLDPSGRPDTTRPLMPAMSWHAPILMIRDIPAGASVGYGQTWRATRPTRLGLVGVGYGDGYPRMLSNRASMIVDNQVCPVVGTISMDQCVIDLTKVPQVSIGDDAIVLDSDPLSPCSAYALASASQTIPYEIVTRIGPRVKRMAVDLPNEDS